MARKKIWYVVADKAKDGAPRYEPLDVGGQTYWNDKATAEKHAANYKADHMRDAWAEWGWAE